VSNNASNLREKNNNNKSFNLFGRKSLNFSI
jgi:hypothetical protein